MPDWRQALSLDPVPSLLAADDPSLTYFVCRDLLDEAVGPIEDLWALPRAEKWLKKQQADGSWRYPGQGRERFPETNYDLLQTFKALGDLVEKQGLDRRHQAIERAAEYIFACQSQEGDIRGILGSQYMPYYHGVISEVLIKAGYADDPRLTKGLDWLLAMRQDDGGWIVPLQALPAKEKVRELWTAPPIPPERDRPHAHLATGMALRALAVHPGYRHRVEVHRAAERLRERFFRSDKYNDRRAPAYWTKFQFPFWWNNLLTALDTLSLLGYPGDDEAVQRGLRWFVENQQADGLWRTAYEQKKRNKPSAREREAIAWLSLAICRVLKRFGDKGRSPWTGN